MKLIRIKSDHGFGIFGVMVDEERGSLLVAVTLEARGK